MDTQNRSTFHKIIYSVGIVFIAFIALSFMCYISYLISSTTVLGTFMAKPIGEQATGTMLFTTLVIITLNKIIK